MSTDTNALIASMTWVLVSVCVRPLVRDKRFYPLVALLLATALTLLLAYPAMTGWTLMQGLLNGCTAIGANSGAKTLLQPRKHGAPPANPPNG